MKKQIYSQKNLLIGLTGKSDRQVITKIYDADKLKITKAALFLEFLNKQQRQSVYKVLISSRIKTLPLVHSRTDMGTDELDFLIKRYQTKFFTIHEDGFKQLKKWDKYRQFLFLELDYNDKLPENIRMEKIGGFCIDLAHFMADWQRKTKEYTFIQEKSGQKIFACNHLNGYTYKGKKDIHRPRNANDLKYLKSLPKFILGKTIALEMNNPIAEQLKYQRAIIKLLNK